MEKVFYKNDKVEVNGKGGQVKNAHHDSEGNLVYNIELYNGKLVTDVSADYIALVGRKETHIYKNRYMMTYGSIEEIERQYLYALLEKYAPTDYQVEWLYSIYNNFDGDIGLKDFTKDIIEWLFEHDTNKLQDYIDTHYYL